MSDHGVDLLIDGTWTPISTLEEDGITISGGRQKDAGESDPLTIECTVIDYTGDLAPRNPRSSNFGKIGQGTPLRVTKPLPVHAWIPFDDSGMTTPDVAALDIVGDIDIRIDLQATSWQGNFGTPLLGKYNTLGNQRSWVATLNDDGYVFFRWSEDGTLGAASHSITWTERPPLDVEGRVTIRFTLDVNDGFSWVVRAYWSHDGVSSGSWTELAGAAAGALPGATSIFSGTAPLRIGHSSIAVGNCPVKVWAVQIRNGIGGTVVASPDFTAAIADAANYTDSTGKVWTPYGGAEFRGVDVRGTVELAKWPSRWNVTESFKWANLQGSGISRRLKRPAARLRDPIFREAVAADNLPRMIEYWPATDSSGSSQIASGLSGGPTMQVFGEPSFAGDARIPGSDPMIAMSTGVSMVAPVRQHTATGTISVRIVVDVPDTGWGSVDSGSGSDSVLVEVTVSGSTIKWWRLEITTTGQLLLHGYDSAGTLTANGSNVNYNLLGRRAMLGFDLVQNGTGVDSKTFARYVADDLTVSELEFTQTFTTTQVGKATQFTVAKNGNLDGGGMGHFMLGTVNTLAAGIDTAIVGNNGETAADRMIRLALELGINMRIIGRARESSPMGPQPSGVPWVLFTQCADTDGGVLYESRDLIALEYRTRGALYNGPAIEITYDEPGESPALQPEEPGDDAVNIFTANRVGGSYYIAQADEGPLSTQTFPDGIGPLEGSGDFNVVEDSDLYGAAWWAIHLSTWDEFRFPVVTFNLTKLELASKAALARAIRFALPGDRLVISNPPGDLPPWPLDLMGQGWSEYLATNVHDYSVNTTPGRPWQVGVAGETPADSDYSELDEAIDADDTVFDVAVEGIPWAEDSLYPLTAVFIVEDREAERFTVLDISGTSSPQTWTVERAIDGDWSAPRPAGTEIRLWAPVRMAR